MTETPILDRAGALERLDGDEEFYAEALAYFTEILPGRFGDLVDAVARADAADVTLHAHSIKGGAANIGADALAEAARRLEEDVTDDGAALFGMLGSIETELQRLMNVLRD